MAPVQNTIDPNTNRGLPTTESEWHMISMSIIQCHKQHTPDIILIHHCQTHFLANAAYVVPDQMLPAAGMVTS